MAKELKGTKTEKNLHLPANLKRIQNICIMLLKQRKMVMCK